MSPQALNLDSRISALNSVLATAKHKQAVKVALRAANGDWPTALATLKNRLPTKMLPKVVLAHSLADWSGDHVPLIKSLVEQPGITSLRDVALNYNANELAGLIDPQTVPAGTPGGTPDEKKKGFASALHNKLFATQTSAVLQRMVQAAEIPIADAGVRAAVAGFLNNQPEFNVRTTSIYTALSQPNAFDGISDEQKPIVVDQLKTLQRVQALSPVADAVPTLF